MPIVKNIAIQTVFGNQSMRQIKPTTATNDPILQAAKRKQFELFQQLAVERVGTDVTLSPMSRLMNEEIDYAWPHLPIVYGKSEVKTAIGDQSFETRKSNRTPQSITISNGPRMHSETPELPTVDKNVDEAANYSSRSNMKSYNTVTYEMVQQSASATDASNVPNSRIHGNGSSGHRVSGGSNLFGYSFHGNGSFCFEPNPCFDLDLNFST